MLPSVNSLFSFQTSTHVRASIRTSAHTDIYQLCFVLLHPRKKKRFSQSNALWEGNILIQSHPHQYISLEFYLCLALIHVPYFFTQNPIWTYVLLPLPPSTSLLSIYLYIFVSTNLSPQPLFLRVCWQSCPRFERWASQAPHPQTQGLPMQQVPRSCESGV